METYCTHAYLFHRESLTTDDSYDEHWVTVFGWAANGGGCAEWTNVLFWFGQISPGSCFVHLGAVLTVWSHPETWGVCKIATCTVLWKLTWSYSGVSFLLTCLLQTVAEGNWMHIQYQTRLQAKQVKSLSLCCSPLSLSLSSSPLSVSLLPISLCLSPDHLSSSLTNLVVEQEWQGVWGWNHGGGETLHWQSELCCWLSHLFILSCLSLCMLCLQAVMRQLGKTPTPGTLSQIPRKKAGTMRPLSAAYQASSSTHEVQPVQSDPPWSLIWAHPSCWSRWSPPIPTLHRKVLASFPGLWNTCSAGSNTTLFYDALPPLPLSLTV